MSISDKTRKIFWGRAGNRCAICKKELVVAATSDDNESIIGDECHIISGKPDGPRYDPSFSPKKSDNLENLILLCKVDHKMVDDQYETYTVHILRQMKNNHELWVSERLSDWQWPKQVRIKRLKQNIPDYLTRLTTGKEILEILEHACQVETNPYDELKSEEEADLVGYFFGYIQDCDILDYMDLNLQERVHIAFELTKILQQLDDNGFWVFGARELRFLEADKNEPMKWPIAIICVYRKDSMSELTIRKNGNRLQ